MPQLSEADTSLEYPQLVYLWRFYKNNPYTLMIQSFRTGRSGQTVQTQIRLLLEEQSDQGLHCLLFYLHLFDEKPYGLGFLFEC